MRSPQRALKAILADDLVRPEIENEIRARSTVASQWSFKPAKAGGVAVAADVVIAIRFTLNR